MAEEIDCVITERYLLPRGKETFPFSFRPDETPLRRDLLDRLNSGINGSINFDYNDESMELRFSSNGTDVMLVGKDWIRKIRANVLERNDLTLSEMLHFLPPGPRGQGTLKGFSVDIRNKKILRNYGAAV